MEHPGPGDDGLLGVPRVEEDLDAGQLLLDDLVHRRYEGRLDGHPLAASLEKQIHKMMIVVYNFSNSFSCSQAFACGPF